MPLSRAFLVILGTALGFAVLGAGFGYVLARLFPSYYQVVFHAEDVPGFDPVSVGLGLGLSQGLTAGLAVGCVVVLAASLAPRR